MFKTILTRTSFAIFAVLIAVIAMFAVMPMVSDLGGNESGPSLTAGLVSAFTFDPMPPSILLSAAPTTIVSGASTILAWNVLGADTCVASDGWTGSKSASGGNQSVSPTVTTTYTLTCTSAGGTESDSITVTVNPVSETPTCTLNASPSTINPSESTTLTWSVKNATSISINNGIGAVQADGSKVVTPTANTSYVLTATGPNGVANCSTLVTVYTPPVVAACTISASKSPIVAGEGATINWVAENVHTVSIDNGVGPVSNTGSKTVYPTVTTTYTLTALDRDGNVVCICTVTIEVKPPTTTAPTCTLTANPISVTKGQTSTLGWTTTNATSVSLNQGIGAVQTTGTKNVNPTVTTSYTLTATGAGGTVTCVKEIIVVEPKQCQLEIVKSGPSTATVGGVVEYSLKFKNIGTSDCTGGGVHIADHLPSQLKYISETHSSNVTAGYGSYAVYDATSHTMHWNAHVLTPGESGEVTIKAEVKKPAACGDFTIKNKGKITALELKWVWVYSNEVTTMVSNPCSNAPTCTLSLAPTTITRGQSATLNWGTQNATFVSIDQGIGTTTQGGSRTVNPTVTTTYTLTAKNDAGTTVSCVATLVVEELPTPVKCDAFSASPSTLTSAGTSTLTWVTTNATSVSINNGVGTVSATGTKAVPVTTTTTYTLTAQGVNGPVTCTTTVTVTPVSVVPKCDAFSVSPTRVSRGGAATLTWATTDATSVSINNGVGTVAADGSTNVTVNSDTTYTLTATNGSASDTCQTTVTVSSGGGGGGSSSPRCTLTASDKNIRAGESVKLSWKNTRTNDILLKDNFGKVIADSKKDRSIDEDEDSVTVNPTRSTSYTLKVINGSRSRECVVDINVNNVTVTSTRSQDPLVAGISLSRLPYTGFDAGPFLTVFFYTVLALWSLGAAYVLVIKEGSVLGVTLHDIRFWRRQAIRENLVQAVPAPNSPIVREGILGSQYVPPVKAPYTPMMATPTSVVGYDSWYSSPQAEVSAPVDAPIVVATPVAEPVTVAPLPSPFVAPTAPPVRDDAADLVYLENRAHEKQILISSDALHFIIAQSTKNEERIEVLDMIIDVAKATYPSEDGWIVINKERIVSLLK